MFNTKDNIAALATGTSGAVSIVKISGPDALEIANKVWHGKTSLGRENARKMMLGRAAGDQVLAVYMPGPASYTGDDVVEIHSHGGTAAGSAVLQELFSCGCRMAERGEFTFRAFVNGKMDLAQAEAVGELIDAGSRAALHLAERQLDGYLSRRVGALHRELASILAECESQLDFSEENIELEHPLYERFAQISENIAQLLSGAGRGRIIREGVSVVLAGAPNAGKSSLLNLLLGYERAIVSAVPGTTRDTLEEAAEFGGIKTVFTDTAGLRENGGELEKLGIERSRRAFFDAQVIFYLMDASSPQTADAELDKIIKEHGAERILPVWNKCDLLPDFHLTPLPEPGGLKNFVRISASGGENIAELEKRFAELVWQENVKGDGDGGGEFAVNVRTAGLLQDAYSKADEVSALLKDESYELAAIGLRDMISDLGKITGDDVAPDILEEIFSRFCIGK